jgi:hypothetical protein
MVSQPLNQSRIGVNLEIGIYIVNHPAKLYLGSLMSILLAMPPVLAIFASRSATNAVEVTLIGEEKSATICDIDIHSIIPLKHKASLHCGISPLSVNAPLP